MFETSLMDLSTGNIPVLRRLHWVIAFIVGAVLFTTAWFILPIVSFGIERPVLQFQSTMLCVFGAATALMIGYAWTDSRREGFNIAWPISVMVLNLAGFVMYLFYSAKKDRGLEAGEHAGRLYVPSSPDGQLDPLPPDQDGGASPGPINDFPGGTASASASASAACHSPDKAHSAESNCGRPDAGADQNSR